MTDQQPVHGTARCRPSPSRCAGPSLSPHAGRGPG
jgi:hypothetical protein